MPHDRFGVGADKIGRHGRSMRSDHDKIGAPIIGFGQDLDINAAKPDAMRDALLWKRKAGADLFKRASGALFLRFVEFGRNIFHETRGQQCFDRDKPQGALRLKRELHRGIEGRFRDRQFGQVDRDQDLFEHRIWPMRRGNELPRSGGRNRG